MAPVKPTVPHPNANYPGQPHEEMKKLVTEKYDPGAANQVIDAWGALGTRFKELATDFNILINGSQTAWTGKAAEGVRAALGKVGTFTDQTGEGFTRTSNAIAAQRDSAVQANKSMPDPVEFNPMKIAGDWLMNKGGFISPVMMVGAPIDMMMTHNKQQDAKAEAVQVMQTRDNTMMSAAMSMPTMESTPQVTQDQGVTQTSSTTSTSSLSNSSRPPSPTGMPGMPPPGTSNNGTTNTSWVAPQTTPPPGVTPPGNNNQNLPPGQNRPPLIAPLHGLPPGTRPPGGGQTGRPPVGGPGMRPGGGGPGGPGGGAGRGMGPGGMGGPGGTGRGMGSFGPASPGGGAGVTGTGSGPGSAGSAGGAAGGRAGAAGAGGMGAGAGKGGEEDKEHKSNYLIPTDEFFDDDRMVAPPVIGG